MTDRILQSPCPLLQVLNCPAGWAAILPKEFTQKIANGQNDLAPHLEKNHGNVTLKHEIARKMIAGGILKMK